MKIDVCDDTHVVIYLSKVKNNVVDFDDYEALEQYFRELFVRLKDYYDIPFTGYYNILVYIDSSYGMILDLYQEDAEYFNYFQNQIEMRMTVEKDSVFLYQIIDPLEIPFSKKIKLYQWKQQFYLQIMTKLSSIEMGWLMENATLCYGEESNKIMKNGRLISIPLKIVALN